MNPVILFDLSPRKRENFRISIQTNAPDFEWRSMWRSCVVRGTLALVLSPCCPAGPCYACGLTDGGLDAARASGGPRAVLPLQYNVLVSFPALNWPEESGLDACDARLLEDATGTGGVVGVQVAGYVSVSAMLDLTSKPRPEVSKLPTLLVWGELHRRAAP